MNHYDYVERSKSFFLSDIENRSSDLNYIINNSSFLVLGGAGSIGQALVKEIFKRRPNKLHVVDISENNLVELVRDIRSSLGYLCKDFKTYALNINSLEYDRFIESDGEYDYVMNLSALKHVRSEKDPFTTFRMIQTNIFNTEKTINQSIHKNTKKYFCVSTDKASNPVNLMGASKRVMELVAMKKSSEISISSSRFANVLFSDGSLVHSFGENRDVFFPKLDEKKHLNTFEELAIRFLKINGYDALKCKTEEEARDIASKNTNTKIWPCYFSLSETTGEKPIEEFFSNTEKLELDLFKSIGIIKGEINPELIDKIESFRKRIEVFKREKIWSRDLLIEIFKETVEEFQHIEKGKFLDDKM